MKRLAYYLAAGAFLAVAACGTPARAPAGGARPTAPAPGTSAPAASPASNGVDKMTARQATHAAVAALSAAHTARVRGTSTSDGRVMNVDLRLAGTGIRGTFTTQGSAFELIIDSRKDFFIKAPAKAWKIFDLPEGAAGLVADRWMKVPADTLGDTPSPTLAGFAQEMMRATPESQTVAHARLNGRDVARITYSDGSVLYVALTGQPYPLRYVSTGADRGQVDFSEFGAPVRIAPPPGAVDLSKLG